MWFPENAKKQMEKEGRTREWVANYCRITLGTLHHMLNGRRSPSKPVLRLMGQCLNCTEEYLLGQEEGIKNAV